MICGSAVLIEFKIWRNQDTVGTFPETMNEFTGGVGDLLTSKLESLIEHV